jgi:hypothetical protein
VPGMPTLVIHGQPTLVGTREGPGSPEPTNHTVTLGGSAFLRYLVRRIDAIQMPVVTPPPFPTGDRDAVINSGKQSIGDLSTLRDLTLGGNAGAISLPAGTYGALTANGNSSFVLGVAGATQPAIYNLQSLTLNGSGQIQIIGPVVLNLATGPSIKSSMGSAEHPEWLTLNVAEGDVPLTGNVTFNGFIVAPDGSVTITGGSTIRGGVISDQLTINENIRPRRSQFVVMENG